MEVIERTVKREDVYRGTCGRKRQVIAQVIERCSNASRLEVIVDVTMIRLWMLPVCGTVLYTHHAITDYYMCASVV